MRKITKTMLAIIIILIVSLNYTMVFAEPPEKPSGETQSQNGGTPPDKPEGEMPNQNGGTPPDKPDGNGGSPEGNNSSANFSHTGATEISSDTTNSGQAYS